MARCYDLQISVSSVIQMSELPYPVLDSFSSLTASTPNTTDIGNERKPTYLQHDIYMTYTLTT